LEYKQHSDESLLNLMAQQDPAALEEFYDRYAQVVYNVIVRIVRDRAVADEILQETFWQVWRKVAEFSGRGAAAAWLYRIARNKSLDHLRRQKARPQPPETASQEDEDLVWERLTGDAIEPEQTAERRWEQQDLLQALAEISADQRLCLELAYFEGMSQRQIAAYANIPLGTVKTRLRSGLQKLGRMLRSAGYQAKDIC
jgi:RNA polymerase sigma-70 factor (ECF subfamily)